jgi:nucleoside-diphosphate-sugar epimerase
VSVFGLPMPSAARSSPNRFGPDSSSRMISVDHLGSQGSPVASLLTAAGHDVRPATRASGADLLDAASLAAPYDGGDAVVLQLPLVYDERALEMAANAARAAERAGVAHLVINASGPVPPEPIGVPFIDARHIAASADVPLVTLLQPTTYMDNLLAPWSAGAVLDEGVARYPMPADAPLYWVATSDVAQAVLRAIESGVAGWFALPGPTATGHEAAAALGRGLGRPVRWETISPEAFGDLMRPFAGDHAADGTAAVYRMLASQPPGPPLDPGPAREALGWAPRDIETWAREEHRAVAHAA